MKTRAGKVVLNTSKVNACPSIRLPLSVPAGQTIDLSLPRTVGEIPTQILPGGVYVFQITVNVNGKIGQQSVSAIPVTLLQLTIRP
ncbi:hypothetical protein [Deinococcus sp.]|uniref:hypothetical protein n=1 Tax=Deinococcus sp. TaxID=47478 RepID=UPI003B5B3899